MNDESRDEIPSDVRVGGDNRVLATFPDRQPTIVQVPREKGSIYYLAIPLESAEPAAMVVGFGPGRGGVDALEGRRRPPGRELRP
jgi:hypothetical protein